MNSEGVKHENEENRDGDHGRLCGGRLSAVPGLAAQTPQEPHHAATDKVKPPTDMKAADQRIDDLVGRMNTAGGMEKTAATATVVTAMVTHGRTMREDMMKMQQGMMAHMMEHMQAGKDSTAMCPMMKMGAMKH